MNTPPLAQLAEATVLSTVQSEFESLREDHPLYKLPVYRIYGPYQRKQDLRRHVIAYDGQNRTTISYPKFIMECKLKRLLINNEEVHHKDRIEFHDNLDNLEVKTEKEHGLEHTSNESKMFFCPVCDITFWLEGIHLARYKTNRKRKPQMKGPYCSRSCNGKDNH